MNILIAADMEGIAGIEDYGDCLPSHPSAYARGRRLMTDEVLVAIEALRAGGAERISVGDWHMVGTNIERGRMPTGVEVRPIADLALVEADPSMTKAMAAAPQPPPARSYPAELRIAVEGEELARTTVAAPGDLLTAIASVFRSSQVSREYRRQLAKLLPAGHDSRGRALQRRLGSIVATPVMRSKERRWLAASPQG